MSRVHETAAAQAICSVEDALRSIERNVRDDMPTVDRTRLALALARLWKERGGTVGGKMRHSDRQLNELLKKQGTIVRSLTPKLVGKTKLKPYDSAALLNLFLSHWNYVGEGDEGGIAVDIYRPISEGEVEEVCEQVLDWLSERGLEGSVGADLAPPLKESIDTAKLIPAEFKDSDAMFVISSEHTLIVAEPSHALVGFRNLLNALFAIDRADDRRRILVWILDLGALDFRDPQAIPRFLNVEALASRFAALKLFREPIAEARWNWLQSRTFIVLHEPQAGRHQATELPAFTAHHFLFDAVPTNWAKSSQFRTLYGGQLERLDERNYTIFLSQAAGDPSGSCELRYFAHAQVMSDERDTRSVHGLRLPPPGGNHEIAFRTVYAAAAEALRINPNLTKLSSTDGAQATGALGRLGFSLLRLDEFMNLWLRPFSTAAA